MRLQFSPDSTYAYLILDTSGPWQLRSGKRGKWIRSILHIAYCIVAAGAMVNGNPLRNLHSTSALSFGVSSVSSCLYTNASPIYLQIMQNIHQNVKDTTYNDLQIQKLICGFGHDGPKLINICKCSKFWSVSIKFSFITVLNFGKCVQF